MAGVEPRTEIRSVGRYDLLATIARGGMGEVYLARMRGLGGFSREVALKLVHDHLETEEAQLGLLEEAKIAARLRHPNAVPVLDVGEDAGRLYIVMDYVEGDSLAGLVRTAVAETGAPIPMAIALRAIIDSLAGLHAAHELVSDDGAPLGLVHRDYSPQNILVGTDGVARITDFGIAKLLGGESTQSGLVKGKIRYMSPQQARGDRLDRRCDVWAAGVVLWELFAGQKLFAGAGDAGTLLKIVNERPPRIREVAPDVHPAFEAVVDAALQRDLEARTPTAAALRKELQRACREAALEAEQDDVAAFVTRCTGPCLADRRARLAVALRSLPPPSSPDLRRSRPDAEGRPASSPDLQRPSTGETTSGHASLVASQRPPEAAHPRGATRSDILSSAPIPTERAAKGSFGWVAVACAVMAFVGVALVVTTVRRSHPNEAASAPVDPPAPLPATSIATAPAESANATPSTTPEAPPKSRVVTFRTSSDVARLRYGDTIVAVAPPRTTVVLAIASAEELPVEATSVDGRTAIGTLGPTATSVALSFASRTSTAAAAGGRPASGDLAPSPYRGKK